VFKLLHNNLSLADTILILIVILTIVVSSQIFLSGKEEKSVYVYKNDRLLGVYPINQDKTLQIDEHNSVRIQNSKVKMLSADCPDRRCVKQSSTDMLPIVCLPNHVVVEIRAKDDKRILIVR